MVCARECKGDGVKLLQLLRGLARYHRASPPLHPLFSICYPLFHHSRTCAKPVLSRRGVTLLTSIRLGTMRVPAEMAEPAAASAQIRLLVRRSRHAPDRVR